MAAPQQKEVAPVPDEKADGAEAVRAAAKGRQLSTEAENAAVEWFLSDEAPMTKVIEINVGPEDKKHWIPWEIRPVDLDVLRRIRQRSQDNRDARRGGTGIDEIQANLQICVAGTVKPDLREMAAKRQVAAPEEALRLRFVQKPGLLGQIAGEILSISGYDDSDLRDPQSVPNS
jgi:hypothetical protein